MCLRKRLSFVSAAVIVALCLASPRTALAGGPVGTPFVIGDQPVDAVYPAVAHSSIFDDYLVVWHRDHPGNDDDVYGQLVNPDGSLSGGRWAIAAGLGPAQRRHPDVTFNPNWNEYLVVWEQHDPNSGATSIRGRRVQSTGEPVGAEILISGPGPRSVSRPQVAHAFTSGTYLVVWENHTQGSVSNDVVGQVVGNDGSLMGANMTIAQGSWTASMERPDLAYNRTLNEFLVVWQQDNGAGRYDVYGRKVTGGGVLLFPESVEIARYTVSSTAPAVAAIPKPIGQGRYLVAWELQYTLGNKQIMARVVHGDGSMVTPGFYVAAAPVDEFHPAVAGNEHGKRFLVSWTTADMSLLLCHARELTLQGEPASGDPVLAEVFADHSAVADGPLSDFLVVFDGQTLVGNVDIHGRLWGNHVYLPLLQR
jgi:hypothetical protein